MGRTTWCVINFAIAAAPRASIIGVKTCSLLDESRNKQMIKSLRPAREDAPKTFNASCISAPHIVWPPWCSSHTRQSSFTFCLGHLVGQAHFWPKVCLCLKSRKLISDWSSDTFYSASSLLRPRLGVDRVLISAYNLSYCRRVTNRCG